MSTRLDAVELLLRTLLDWQVEPETSTGRLQRRGTVRGVAPHHRQPCAACDGEGVKRDRFRRSSPCAACAGRGWIVVDAYTLTEVGTHEGGTVAHERRALCDRCGGSGVHRGMRCPTCDGEGRRKVRHFTLTLVERGDGDEDVLDRALRRTEQRDRAGSYRELELLLRVLRRGDPHAHALAVSVYELAEREHGDLAQPDAEALDRGVSWLSANMPAEIRVPRYAAPAEAHRARLLAKRRAEARRAEEVLAASAGGAGAEEIAARYGVSRATVYRVLGRASVYDGRSAVAGPA